MINELIEGVSTWPLKKIVDERGMILRMVREGVAPYEKFGEIYFSGINPGVIKGWKMHTKQNQNIAVPVGLIKLVIFDPRPNSKTRGNIFELETGIDNYILIHIPNNTYYGWKCLGNNAALIAACSDIPHDPQEAVSLPIDSPQIPYDRW